MVQKNVVINNPTGLHARPANDFCKLANQFTCSTKFVKDGTEGDAKSIFNILVAAMKCGTEITIKTDGVDEEEALDALVTFVEGLTE